MHPQGNEKVKEEAETKAEANKGKNIEDEAEEDDQDDSDYTKEGDDTLRMGDHPETNPTEPRMASFGKYGSPALDRIPHPDTPTSVPHTVKRPAPENPKAIDGEEIIHDGLLLLQCIVNEAVVEGALMNNVPGSHLLDLVQDAVRCVLALVVVHDARSLNPTKMARYTAAESPPPAATSLPSSPPKTVDRLTDTPCWWCVDTIHVDKTIFPQQGTQKEIKENVSKDVQK